jgi:hypothetical protein
MMENNLMWIQSVLNTTVARWRNLADTIPGDLLTRQPAPAEWSAVECLQHLVDTERHVFPVRTRYFLEGKDSFPGFDPDEEGAELDSNVSATKLLQEFTILRANSLSLLADVEESDLGRQATHGELGPVTLGELLNEWAAHDLMHTVQAERAMMQPFIRDSGPWKPFFADHAVDAKDRA